MGLKCTVLRYRAACDDVLRSMKSRHWRRCNYAWNISSNRITLTSSKNESKQLNGVMWPRYVRAASAFDGVSSPKWFVQFWMCDLTPLHCVLNWKVFFALLLLLGTIIIIIIIIVPLMSEWTIGIAGVEWMFGPRATGPYTTAVQGPYRAVHYDRAVHYYVWLTGKQCWPIPAYSQSSDTDCHLIFTIFVRHCAADERCQLAAKGVYSLTL